MNKLNIVVVSDDLDIKIRIKNLLGEDEFAIVGFFGYDSMTNLKILGHRPDVVIMVYDNKTGNVFEIAEQIYLDVKGASVVLLSADVNVELLSNAMQHGIKQVLQIDTVEKTLREAIIKANSLEKKRCEESDPAARGRCRVISFFGGKGGTGKTTLAVNTAVRLALNGRKTLIIDADLQFGDVTVLLDLDPQDTIYELSRESGDMSIDVMKSILSMHKSGLDVLAAPKSPELAEYITDKTIELIINTARPYYEFIIIDLAPGFSDTAVAVIESSDIVNLVANVDIVSLRNAKICLGILDALRQKEKTSLVLNRAAPGIISKKDFEKILNMEPKLCLPDDTKTVSSSMNRGIPFVMCAPRTAVSKAISAYVGTL
jgi:pilus assembly protein CpaE